MTGEAYPLMLSPIQVGRHVLRNRVVMGSMHTRLDTLEDSMARQAAFYAARAQGGVGLIVSGGYAPNEAGLLEPGAPILRDAADADRHRPILDAVHGAGAKMVLQILHAGRYAKHQGLVAPSAIRAPINTRTPREMTGNEIEQTIRDFAACAVLAVDAGFDGVEVMGSEGYLINQFAAARTNHRCDDWGGTVERRHRFAVEVVRTVRAAIGPDALLMFRISAMDLVEGGATGAEVEALARSVEEAGADVLDTGIGWHEAQVPTISYTVPRAAWRGAAARVKRAVSIPVVASNRINTPAVAEDILQTGDADLVAMARPMLADPDFVRKAAAGRADEINVCIACNQACLDFIFSERVATCLVNPRACRETEVIEGIAARPARIAVVGAGAAGLACATQAAKLGHRVTLFEAADRIGGQLNLARAVPGKQEFDELLRYFHRMLELHRVELRLGTQATADMLVGFDRVVIAAGVTPRIPDLPGIGHPSVASYADVLAGRIQAGRRVVVMGAGGIGFDVAETLSTDEADSGTLCSFEREWGVDPGMATPGGLVAMRQPRPAREVTLVQRSAGRPGARLGVSTGWVVRSRLRRRGVMVLAGATYLGIDDAGLHIEHAGAVRVLGADTIVLCTGQEPADGLVGALTGLGIEPQLIGGARLATELDAMRAIAEGTALAGRL